VNTTVIEKAAGFGEREMISFVKSGEMKRHEVYALIEKLALDRRRDGETRASAVTRFITKDPLGMDLFQVQKAMPGKDVVIEHETEVRKDIRAGTDAEADALNTWNALLAGIMRGSPHMTRTQAHDEAMKDPRARKIWEAVKRRDLAKSYRGLGVYSEAEIAKIVSG
jgi:hypothetical protein